MSALNPLPHRPHSTVVDAGVGFFKALAHPQRVLRRAPLLAAILVLALVEAGCTASRSAAETDASPVRKARDDAGARNSDRRAAPPKARRLRPTPGRLASTDATGERELERRAKAHANYAAGLIEQLNDNPDAAFERFRSTVESDVSNEALVIEVARRYLQRKQFDEALQLLHRAAAQPGADVGILHFLGTTLAQLGRRDDAIRTYREAIRLSPGQIPARLVLARLLVEDKRGRDALDVLAELESQANTEPRFWIDLSELYLQLGQSAPDVAQATRARAVSALERAAAQKPDEPATLLRLADRYLELENPAAAEAIYHQLRISRPRDPVPVAKLAELYLRSGRLKEGTEQLEILKRENPANPIPHYYLGLLAAEGQDFTNAVTHFRDTLRLNAQFESAYPDLAGALLAIDDPDGALNTLEDARSRFKPTFRIAFLTGIAAGRKRNPELTQRYFKDAESIAKTNQPAALDHRFYFQWGASLERAGDPTNAAVHLEKAIELKPDFSDALNHLGYMWAERGENLERAHMMIRKAVDLEPDNEAYLDSLAWVLHQLGRSNEALPWIEKAIQKAEKPDPTLFDHLGDILNALRRMDDARTAWQRSLEIEKSPAIEKKIHGLPQPQP